MAKGVRNVAAGLAITLVAARSVAAEPPTVTLRVHNAAGVEKRWLQTAQDIATQIYEAIGVQLVWRDDDDSDPPTSVIRLVIVLMSPRDEQRLFKTLASKDVLGVAPLNTGRIYVFCSRVDTLARSAERQFDAILGRVLAHEVGHQLLPAQGHSAHGIMQAKVDHLSPTTPGFMLEQGDSIRRLLMGIVQTHVGADDGVTMKFDIVSGQ
jgi:hypothetical protein